jgi:long-chain fatty acid transport protein
MIKQKALVSALIVGGLVSPLAYATNGMLPIGYGLKTEGMGGAGIALPQDALAAATNPAGMVMVGDRIDIGLEWFRPNRTTTITGGAAAPFNFPNGSYSGNGKSDFFIPQIGYNKMINANTSLGVSVFGNGGMNTQYNNNPFVFFGGSGPAGVDLQQLFISPTWSMKINPDNAIGVSLNLAYQTFAATGIQGFNPSGINVGHDHSTGYGLRLGWTGKVTPDVTLGATYQTKTKMSKFSKYNWLFPDQGAFDIPANYGVGVAVKATPATTVAFDVERIEYSGVPTIGNTFSAAQAGLLGTSNGPGFGWKSINAYKLGASYAYSSNLTLRAGLDHCDNPIPSSQVTLNILAPGVVQDHISLGATWKLENKSEVTVAWVHSMKASVNGPSAFNPATTINLGMYQDAIGVSYGW